MSREIADARGLAHTLLQIGAYTAVRDYDKGVTYLQESLTLNRATRDKNGTGKTLLALGMAKANWGHLEKAEKLLKESLDLLEESGDIINVAEARSYLGLIAERQGDFRHAETLKIESLAVLRQSGEVGEGVAELLNLLGILAAKQGNPAKAKELLAEAIQLFHRTGTRWGGDWCLGVFAVLAIRENRLLRATRLLGAQSHPPIDAPKEPARWPLTDPFYNSLYEMREQLGEERFEAERKTGQAMSRDEAITYALEDEE